MVEKNSFRYAAFLRGINVGGHGVIRMAILERVRLQLDDPQLEFGLESAGVKQV
jgi:hypothetical protein